MTKPEKPPAPERSEGRLLRWGTTLLCLLTLLSGCGSGVSRPPEKGEVIGELQAGDVLLVTDQVGSLLAETDPWGKPQKTVALSPYGFARHDESDETQKHAGTPRDAAVGLDHMGARFYAPDLGVWTSADPLSLSDPERQVTGEFAAANSYAYANLTPVVAADRDGRFWHIAIGAGIGAVVGGGAEAARQLWTDGRIVSWGRVGAASLAGGAAGGLVAAVPGTGLVGVMSVGGGVNVATGVTQRLIESGGRSAGTLTDMAADGAVGMAGGAIAKGAGPAVKVIASKFKAKAPVSADALASSGGGRKLYHYTAADPGGIAAKGLMPGASGRVYTTPDGSMTAIQAQIDLALPPNRGLPGHLLEIDVGRLKELGIHVPDGTQVGRMYNMPGGGTEVVFPQALPAEAMRVVR